MCLEFCSCCYPCGKFQQYVREKRERDKISTKDDDPSGILILENALSSTVDLIVENASWATAGILSVACSLTILYTEWENVWETWIYFAILLLIAIIYGTYPQTLLVDDWELIGKNLKLQMNTKTDTNVDNKDGKRNVNTRDTMTIAEYLKLQQEDVITADREAIAKRLNYNIDGTSASSNINDNNRLDSEDDDIDVGLLEESKNDNDTGRESGQTGNGSDGHSENKNVSDSNIRKLARLTHIEANILFKNMNSLAIATFANVIALTFNTAIITTVSTYFTNESVEILTYWIVALFETILTLGLTFQLTKSLIKTEKYTYQFITIHGIENSKKELISYQSQFSIVYVYVHIASFECDVTNC